MALLESALELSDPLSDLGFELRQSLGLEDLRALLRLDGRAESRTVLKALALLGLEPLLQLILLGVVERAQLRTQLRNFLDQFVLRVGS